MSFDIAAELRSWCIDAHLPSGASECLLCEAAQAVELYREELYQLARLATAGWEGEASGRDRDVQLYVGRLAYRHRQDRMGARLQPLVTWPMMRGALRTLAHHDVCDACGKCTVVTDVWIDRTPMTLCQPCVLDALTAEGESLGQYWEIEP